VVLLILALVNESANHVCEGGGGKLAYVVFAPRVDVQSWRASIPLVFESKL
jgi:hypothetical protein